MSSNLLVSIIIPTKNEEKNIGRLINSIQKSKGFDKDKTEIIVVDNPGTTDKTLEIATKLGAIGLSKGPERSSQRNFGAENAKGEYLYFVDADMEFSNDLLGEILSEIETNGDKTGYIVPERIPGGSLYCRAVNIEKQTYDGRDEICGCRIFSRELFNKIGGYNIEFIMGEDWDLDKRLRECGLEVKHLKNHVWHHEENLGFWGSIQKKIYYAKNLKGYTVGVQAQVNPIQRYAIMLSKPNLFLKDPIAYLYMVVLKTTQFGVGLGVLILNKFK
jgi:glycosyltransferase involved in cell wall biosynthesis